MTSKEAIKLFQNGIDMNLKLLKEPYGLAIEALKKQIPAAVGETDPVDVKALDKECGEIRTYKCHPCPSCGKWITNNKSNLYCNRCGQKIDWSVEE